MGLGIPPLIIKVTLESNPLKSIMLVRRLAALHEHPCSDSLVILTIRSKTWFLGAGFLAAPPISLKVSSPTGYASSTKGRTLPYRTIPYYTILYSITVTITLTITITIACIQDSSRRVRVAAQCRRAEATPAISARGR